MVCFTLDVTDAGSILSSSFSLLLRAIFNVLSLTNLENYLQINRFVGRQKPFTNKWLTRLKRHSESYFWQLYELDHQHFYYSLFFNNSEKEIEIRMMFKMLLSQGVNCNVKKNWRFWVRLEMRIFLLKSTGQMELLQGVRGACNINK